MSGSERPEITKSGTGGVYATCPGSALRVVEGKVLKSRFALLSLSIENALMVFRLLERSKPWRLVDTESDKAWVFAVLRQRRLAAI